MQKETEQLELSGMIPWFESVGLNPQDAKDVALACVRKNFFNVLSLCSMPEKELCEALDALPIGLRQFVPMIIKAARSSKATRERATLTPSNATTTEWMRNVGFDDVTAAHVGSVLEASHMRSKGLVLAQDPAELELDAGKLPAPAKHAFLAVVRDARSQQQFTLGHPPRLITDKWCAPVKPYFIQLGIFDDETIRQIEIACGNDDLKIRCLWSLFAMEESELRSALTAAKLPLIVQKTLINSINVEADRSETQWVIDTTSPGDGGQLMIYARKEWEEKENQKLEEKQEAEERKQEEERKQQEEKRKQEAQTYEPTGCCGFGNKCRKCGKRKSDHFTPALYCIDSQTRGSSSQDTCTRRGRAKVTPVQEGEVEDIDHVGEDVKGPTPGDDTVPHIQYSELAVESDAMAVGSFKDVYKALWLGKNRTVALLVLRNTYQAALEDMEHEIRMFRTLGLHKHLVVLLATCTHPQSQDKCMVMEFAPLGSLDHVLSKADEDGRDIGNLVKIVVGMQVADAMDHLHLYNVVHRDLAIRNILTFRFDPQNWKDVQVKVADYGLSLLVKKGLTVGASVVEISTNNSNTAGPTRWMAPESLKRRVYSKKTDVWSFGVVLVEIWTLGMIPYHLIADDKEVARMVLEGERLLRPDNCPDHVYTTMQNCWKSAPKDRPSMTELQTALQEAFAEESLETSKTECVVCLSAEPVMALLPCGHRCACESCGLSLRTCPICRTDVQEVKRIFS